MEDTDAVTNVLESPKLDTGHTSRHPHKYVQMQMKSVNKA